MTTYESSPEGCPKAARCKGRFPIAAGGGAELKVIQHSFSRRAGSWHMIPGSMSAPSALCPRTRGGVRRAAVLAAPIPATNRPEADCSALTIQECRAKLARPKDARLSGKENIRRLADDGLRKLLPRKSEQTKRTLRGRLSMSWNNYWTRNSSCCRRSNSSSLSQIAQSILRNRERECASGYATCG